MKKNIILLIAIILLTYSCSEKELNIINPNQTTFELLMKSELGVESLVLGIYGSTREVWSTRYEWRFTRSDEYNIINKSYEDYRINKFLLNPADPSTFDQWSSAYLVIENVNSILFSLVQAPISNELRDRFEGELRFFRAINYFDLVRFFGAIPLFTEPLTIDESRNINRSEVTKVYNQIIEDLNISIEYLPETALGKDYGRATKYAARAYLAKVFMTLKDWKSANGLLESIISSGNYTFYEGNYIDIFARKDLQPKFYIFMAHSRSDILGNSSDYWWHGHMPSDIDPGIYGISGEIDSPPISSDLIQSFDDADVRKDVSIALSYENSQGQIRNDFPWLKKFHQGTVSANATVGTDFPFIRYTDIVLMYAEVSNELNQNIDKAIMWLNKVRTRAGLNSIFPASGNELRLAIEKERKHEFVGEGQRWFDLVRTGRAIEVMNQHFISVGENITIDQNKLLFPISEKELSRYRSDIQQNPGY